MCTESSRALLNVRDLRVAAHLAVAVDEAYAEATVGLQLALQSVCSGFRAERYAKVPALQQYSRRRARMMLAGSQFTRPSLVPRVVTLPPNIPCETHVVRKSC